MFFKKRLYYLNKLRIPQNYLKNSVLARKKIFKIGFYVLPLALRMLESAEYRFK